MSSQQQGGNGRPHYSNIQYGTRIQTTNKEYRDERRRRYPNAYAKKYPNERVRADYEAYDALTTESKNVAERYDALYAKERMDFDAYGTSNEPRYREEKAFYRDGRAALFPDQHGKLVNPAQERHEEALRLDP